MTARPHRPVVAFDGSVLGDGPVTGVAGSFLTTLAAYTRMSPFDCVLFTPQDGAGTPTPATTPHIAGIRAIPCVRRGRWGRLRSLRRACLEVGARLLHAPVTAVPRASCPTVATVHDLPWLYPELRREPGSRLLRRLAVRFAARTAAAVIVPSHATRRDLHRFARVPAGRVLVIPHGVTAPATPAAEVDLRGPFLVLGDDRPRKNRSRVTRAHAVARAWDSSLPALRFIGPGHGHGDGYDHDHDHGHGHGHGHGHDHGHDHGYVDAEEKWRVLRHSRALIHASLLEGFGLPVLEAFAHGVPVVCSDRTSLPELAADAGLHTDPTDVMAIAAAILRIHQDDALRRTLRERGLQRAREFTPERSAAGWLDLHTRLLA